MTMQWIVAALALTMNGAGDPVLAGSTQAQEEPPSSGLNHVYVVLDEATFDVIRASEFVLGRFASVDEGLPEFTRANERSASLYIRGKETYLELLGPENSFGEPVGKVGIGLGVDVPSELDAVERAWTDQLGEETIRRLQKWNQADPPVPWHEVVLHPETVVSPTLVVWASAYRAEFLPWLYPDRTAEENGVTRADFLAPQFDGDRVLEDVTGLTLALPPELVERFAAQLESIGYERTGSDEAVHLRVDRMRFSLVPPEGERTRLMGIEFRTTREYRGPPVVRLGDRSVLSFGPGRSGRWLFL